MFSSYWPSTRRLTGDDEEETKEPPPEEEVPPTNENNDQTTDAESRVGFFLVDDAEEEEEEEEEEDEEEEDETYDDEDVDEEEEEEGEEMFYDEGEEEYEEEVEIIDDDQSGDVSAPEYSEVTRDTTEGDDTLSESVYGFSVNAGDLENNTGHNTAHRNVEHAEEADDDEAGDNTITSYITETEYPIVEPTTTTNNNNQSRRRLMQQNRAAAASMRSSRRPASTRSRLLDPAGGPPSSVRDFGGDNTISSYTSAEDPDQYPLSPRDVDAAAASVKDSLQPSQAMGTDYTHIRDDQEGDDEQEEENLITFEPGTEGEPNRSTEERVFSDKLGEEFFLFMADNRWVFAFALPIIFVILIGVGWSADDKVEEQIEALWIPEGGRYAENQEYTDSLGVEELGTTFLPAVAVSRDGENLMTARRLEEIRDRMEETEKTVIEHNGYEFTWDDLCSDNFAPYELPCLRVSPMDLFQEARWPFSEEKSAYYYEELIQKKFIDPRIPRYGMLKTKCSEECGFVLAYRTDPASIGFSNVEPDPLLLLKDIGDLEYDDVCRICIEEKYQATVMELHGSIQSEFSQLLEHVLKARNASPRMGSAWVELDEIASKLGQLSASVTENDVAEFYAYYETRQLYGEVGVDTYVESYAEVGGYLALCMAVGASAGLTCPQAPQHVDRTTVVQRLLDHADNTFSSVTTSGSPLPFWSQGDGTGELFRPNGDTGLLYPVSGSGVNMSAPLDSLSYYLELRSFQPRKLVDPNAQEWKDLVEANPLYSWFMASLTPADRGTLCGNGNLTGTNGAPALDEASGEFFGANSARWCTKYNIPNANDTGPAVSFYTQQHFARMWYDLLVSDMFGIVQGKDDPYSYTLSTGCDYELRGERFSYTGQTARNILRNASRALYNIDEGTMFGAVSRSMLIGGATPPVGNYDYQNPLKEVIALQSLYPVSLPKDIRKRVANCNRPGGPISITLEEAEAVLEKWKEAMENAWNRGWDNARNGRVQFVSFSGETGGIGSVGRMFRSTVPESNKLTTIAIIVIGLFSIAFVFSRDSIESRVLLMVIGVFLVVLSFHAGLGFALILGMKLNVVVTWTLPFVLIGLGVDDVYIIVIAIKKQGGYTKNHWLKAMKEVAMPITMTSLIKVCIMAFMNISSIPLVHNTGSIACFCVIAQYLSVLFCFPAVCLLDLKRQKAGREDFLFCLKNTNPPSEPEETEDIRQKILYEDIYKPVVLSQDESDRYSVHSVVFLASILFLAIGAGGMTQHDVGFGLEDFFPSDNPAGHWASLRAQYLPSWSIGIQWGAINYTDADTQLRMIEQFEDVVASPFVAEVDTKHLWIADFALWTTRHCNENLARKDFDRKLCGRDQLFEQDASTCAGSWVPNALNLREKNFQNITDVDCVVHEGGVCRPRDRMHVQDFFDLETGQADAQSFCPVIDGWSDAKWKFCLERWRNLTGVTHEFVLENEQGSPTECGGVYNQDENIVWPLPFSRGPTMFAVDMFSHQDTLDMVLATRAICDDATDIHCWLSGPPYNYWEQYSDIFDVLMALFGCTVATGLGVSFVGLSGKFAYETKHPIGRVLLGSLVGALLIGFVVLSTLVTVIGLSFLAGVHLNALSNLSFILSASFSVEYSVHIVYRWMRSGRSHETALDRVDGAVSFLMLPMFMSFISSIMGVLCLAFTDFQFNTVYFFKPLMIAMIFSYWFGCFLLPSLLVYLDIDPVKMGKKPSVRTSLQSQLFRGTLKQEDVYLSDEVGPWWVQFFRRKEKSGSPQRTQAERDDDFTSGSPSRNPLRAPVNRNEDVPRSPRRSSVYLNEDIPRSPRRTRFFLNEDTPRSPTRSPRRTPGMLGMRPDILDEDVSEASHEIATPPYNESTMDEEIVFYTHTPDIEIPIRPVSPSQRTIPILDELHAGERANETSVPDSPAFLVPPF